MINSKQASQLLEERIVPGTASEEELLSYYAHLSSNVTNAGGSALVASEFYQPGDVDRWRRASEGWPDEVPATCALPDLGTICRRATDPSGSERCSAFMATIEAAWTRCQEWMGKRDEELPEETSEQRAARLQREAQARYRARKSEDTEPKERARLVRQRELYDVYMDACRDRKANRERDDERVRTAWDEYKEARDAA